MKPASTSTLWKWLLSSFLVFPCALSAQEEVFEFESYKDIMELFEKLDYTEASWESGERKVYRAYVQNMPSRWRGKHSKEIEVKMKKEVFLRTLAPLVLRSNELILEDRGKMLALPDAGIPGKSELCQDDTPSRPAPWAGTTAPRW